MSSPTKKHPKRPRTPSAKAKDSLVDTMEIFRDVTATAQNEGSTPKRAKKRPLTLEATMQQVLEGLTGMATEMAGMATEIAGLKREIQQLKAEVQEKDKNNPPPAGDSTPASYAFVANRSNPAPPLAKCAPTITPRSSENWALHPVQINMARAGADTYDLLAMKTELESLWEEQIETAGIRCRVVTSTREHTFKLLFKTNADAMAIRRCTGWLNGNFQHARIEGEQWYPIKVDRVNKLHLKNLHDKSTHDDLCKLYGEENGDVKIKKMRWLGGKVHLLYGSLVVYLSEKDEAEKLLQNQTMEFKGESGFTKQYIKRVVPQRCFKCQNYGHHQLRCTQDQICSHCAEPGHDRIDCMTPSPKCASCQGPYQANDPGCPTYKKMLAEITPGLPHA